MSDKVIGLTVAMLLSLFFSVGGMVLAGVSYKRRRKKGASKEAPGGE